MEYDEGLIITGTRGAGKTTLARRLAAVDTRFRQIGAVTTRSHRVGDEEGSYDYLDDQSFEVLASSSELIVETSYGPYRYGIRRDDVLRTTREGMLPIVVITPASALPLASGTREVDWIGFFIDASDSNLDLRLTSDGRPPTEEDISQRFIDRSYARPPLQVLDNSASIEHLVSEVRALTGDRLAHRSSLTKGAAPRPLDPPTDR